MHVILSECNTGITNMLPFNSKPFGEFLYESQDAELKLVFHMLRYMDKDHLQKPPWPKGWQMNGK